jgi:NADH-quinone oxidoreductase subunit J
MWAEYVFFFLAAFGALAGAIGVVSLRNPFYSVLALVAHLLSLSVLFLLLRAEFLAAAQVVVYAGAVMVLYVFVVAYIGGVDEPIGLERGAIGKLGPVFALALLVELTIAVIGSALPALGSRGADVPPGFGSPGEIGRLLLERFLVAFEAASLLLLVAAVGAVVLARRRRGLEELGGEELPERAGTPPLTPGSGGPSAPGEQTPTKIPAGTAEGAGDPSATRSPDHQTQENPDHDPQPVEPVGGGTPA